MTADAVDLGSGAPVVDAAVVARELGIDEETLRELLRSRQITSLCEAGIDNDAGRYRLTFFHGNRRLRLVVDADGRVVQRSSIDFGDRPLPPVIRRPVAALNRTWAVRASFPRCGTASSAGSPARCRGS